MTRFHTFLRSASAFAVVSSIAPSLLHAQGAIKGALPAAAPAPGIIHACYVPASGTIYRIKAPGTKPQCTAPEHVAFSWSDGTSAEDAEAMPSEVAAGGGAVGGAGVIGTPRFRLANFTSMSIPFAGVAPVVLATVSFTPTASGLAVMSGRGYCNMQPTANSDDRINIVAAPAGVAPFAQNTLPEWGVMNVPQGGTWGIHQHNYTTLTVLPVTKGVAYTVSLFARHEVGAIHSDCSGSFTAELF